MQIVAPILYFGWKFTKKTKIIPPEDVDLVWEAPIVDAYEASFTEKPVGFWSELVHMLGIRRRSLRWSVGGYS
jgi:amino acid transporter